jgi:hypothetical protein
MATAPTDPRSAAASSETALVDRGGRVGLDLHEGIGDPRRQGGQRIGCGRWPEHLLLLNTSTGELRPGRCRATNLCVYCALLFAIETSEMLLLDAMEDAPTIYLVLTAREHLTRDQCRDHLRQIRRAVRRRWSDGRWAVTVEFQRRGALHLNLIVKGVPVESCEELLHLVVDVWCARVDALPAGQWAGVIAEEVGVVRYISQHFLKASQAPAIGWRGHRFSCTRDYLVRPASVLRAEARESLRVKRVLHRGGSLEDAAREAVEAWVLLADGPAELRWADTGRKVIAA